jgi:hypothetical protein
MTDTDSPASVIPEVAGKRCALYRHYDKHGILLYVGISETLVARGKQHSKNSDWSQYAHRVIAAWYDTRSQAELAEREAIEVERPIFNRQYNDSPDAETRRIAYFSAKFSDRRPVVVVSRDYSRIADRCGPEFQAACNALNDLAVAMDSQLPDDFATREDLARIVEQIAITIKFPDSSGHRRKAPNCPGLAERSWPYIVEVRGTTAYCEYTCHHCRTTWHTNYRID